MKHVAHTINLCTLPIRGNARLTPTAYSPL
jgi:hypothetical protein